MLPSVTINMLEICDSATSKGKISVLGENKSDLAADTLSVILTAIALKLPETRKGLLKEELKMT